jgi:thioredoxin reductase (NADPH)
LKNVKSGATQELTVDGVFIAIGHKPATELFVGQLPFKNGGYLQTAAWSTQTEIPGVFAAGDVSDDIYRQAVTAAGMGCMAALETERWLHTQESSHKMAAE